MGYRIIPEGPVTVQHTPSKKKVTVELTDTGAHTRVRESEFKEDSESFHATFEGSFQFEIEAKPIDGKVTVIVEYTSSLDGQEVDGIVDSSISLPSCEILEISNFEIQEVEGDY